MGETVWLEVGRSDLNLCPAWFGHRAWAAVAQAAHAGEPLMIQLQAMASVWELSDPAVAGNYTLMAHRSPSLKVTRNFEFRPVVGDGGTRRTEAHASEMASYFRINDITFIPGSEQANGDYLITVDIRRSAAPVALAHTVSLRRGEAVIGKPLDATGYVSSAGKVGIGGLVHFAVPRGAAGPAQLVFEPSAEEAEHDVDAHEYSGVVVKLDVTIPQPTRRAADP